MWNDWNRSSKTVKSFCPPPINITFVIEPWPPRNKAVLTFFFPPLANLFPPFPWAVLARNPETSLELSFVFLLDPFFFPPKPNFWSLYFLLALGLKTEEHKESVCVQQKKRLQQSSFINQTDPNQFGLLLTRFERVQLRLIRSYADLSEFHNLQLKLIDCVNQMCSTCANLCWQHYREADNRIVSPTLSAPSVIRFITVEPTWPHYDVRDAEWSVHSYLIQRGLILTTFNLNATRILHLITRGRMSFRSLCKVAIWTHHSTQYERSCQVQHSWVHSHHTFAEEAPLALCGARDKFKSSLSRPKTDLQPQT